MSTDKPALPWAQLDPKLPHLAFKDRIPVHCLQAIPQTPFDLPGRSGSSSIKTTELSRRNADHHIIEWIPAMRSFVIVFYEASQKRVHVRYIPEGNVRQWEPASEHVIVPR